MTSTSRRLSERGKHQRNNSTPGKTKGGNCVRPKDHGLAINGSPYKLKGGQLNAYQRIWGKYKAANGGSSGKK